jgi:hypothetical protein
VTSLSRAGQTLTLLISREPAPALPTTAASSTIWRDGEGVIVAFGGTVPEGRWMTIPRVGSFLFGELTAPVVAYPDSQASDDLVEDAYRRTVLPLGLQALGREVLHASAVLTRNGVLALCAVSGIGKSTTAYAISRRGYQLWADDAVQFSIGGDDVEAIPLPFTLRLKGPSSLPGRQTEGVHQPPAAPLAAICVLDRVAGDDVTVSTLDAVDAFPAVLTHAYCFDLGNGERKRRMMDSYLALVVRVPVFRVSFPAGLEHLERVADSILQANGS